MLIWAVTKFSLLDFPKEQTCIVFTVWCNLRCGYCHNPDFVLPENIKDISKNIIPENIFFNFLEKRKGLLTGVSICWWEPTLQKDLYDFCRKVKEMWFKVKLDTNWKNPRILQKLLDYKLLDYIAMDIKNPLEKYCEVTKVEEDIEEYKQSIEIIKSSNIDYEFRTTIIKWIHDEYAIEEIAKAISGAKKYFLQNFKAWKTLEKSFVWKSFLEIELEKFQKIAKLYVENVWIRN